MATNTGATWTDPVVVDAHTYARLDLRLLLHAPRLEGAEQHRQPDRPHRRALGEPRRLHEVQRRATSPPTTPTRSSAAGAATNREDLLMFGEGLPSSYYSTGNGGQTVDYIAAALDVVAHEYSHGITDYTSNLDLQERVGRAQRGVLGHHEHRRRVLPADGRARACSRRTTSRARTRGGPACPARCPGIRSFIDPAAYGDPGPLLEALHRHQRQRRRPHQLVDRQPRVLPGGRGGHQPHVRPVGDRRRRGQPRQDREGVLPRLHHADVERHVQPGPGEDHPGGSRRCTAPAARSRPPSPRHGTPWACSRRPPMLGVRDAQN